MTRCLITGGAGFIGSHLAEILIHQGHVVTVIDNLSTGRFENIQSLIGHPNFKFAIDSITNEIVLDRLASECDVIFHLAAAVGVQLIVDSPVHTIETNVMGTESVLKAALRYRAKVLITSTSEVYGKGNGIPFREDDDVLLGPTSRSRWAYAASKMLDEFLALAYHREKGLPVVICRLFNTVGPRQTGRYGMVIPRFVQQVLHGKPMSVYGDGSQSRCFMHVYDAVDAIIKLSQCTNATGLVFNVGSTQEVSIRELAEKVYTIANELRGITDNDTSNKDIAERIEFVDFEKVYPIGFEDMNRRLPDITKIREYIGWEPRYALDDILREVIVSFQST